MKKYLVRFTTIDDDYDKEWCNAANAKEAEKTIKREHWNIKRVTSVEEI